MREDNKWRAKMTKRFNSIFDIIGPVMVGPSSSHTAGAVRIANVARIILNEEPTKVNFYLYGSFAETYKGHGTDFALAAGIQAMLPHDEKVSQSLLIAQEKGIPMNFIPLADVQEHPNTVEIIMYNKEGQKIQVKGASIGGGNIEIVEVNKIKVSINGTKAYLLVFHQDTPGMIYQVSDILRKENINIATMSVERNEPGKDANMTIALDDDLPSFSIDKLKVTKGIEDIIYIPKQMGGHIDV